jgi:hypothetical protein
MLLLRLMEPSPITYSEVAFANSFGYLVEKISSSGRCTAPRGKKLSGKVLNGPVKLKSKLQLSELNSI